MPARPGGPVRVAVSCRRGVPQVDVASAVADGQGARPARTPPGHAAAAGGTGEGCRGPLGRGVPQVDVASAVGDGQGAARPERHRGHALPGHIGGGGEGGGEGGGLARGIPQVDVAAVADGQGGAARPERHQAHAVGPPAGIGRTLMIFLVAVSHRSTSPLYMPTARVAVPGLNAADSTAWLPAGAARVADGLTSVRRLPASWPGSWRPGVPGLEASNQGMAAAAARTAPASAITRGRRRGCRAGSPPPGPGPDRAPWPAAAACVRLGFRYRSAVTPGPGAGLAGSRSPAGEVAPGRSRCRRSRKAAGRTPPAARR